MKIDKPIVIPKEKADPGVPTNAILGKMISSSTISDDASEGETSNADLEQILAQCYRIARERARQSHLARSASSIQAESLE
jgi:hypothetical protein